MNDDYISRLDEIDKWLFDSFGILPGACSSQENLRHTTARMVAELWQKKESSLTWKDVADIVILADTILDGNEEEWRKQGAQAYYEAVLKAFNALTKSGRNEKISIKNGCFST